MRRILLDQGLAPGAAVLLRTEGWDALHVMEVGLDRATDFEILEFARQSGRSASPWITTFMRILPQLALVALP